MVVGATSRRLAVIGALAVLGAVAAGRPARAQSAEAEALFDDGNRLMTEHKLAQACDAFEASNRAEPRAGTLIRLGECREQNQQLASAWSAYRDALGRVKDPRKRDYASGRVAALEPRLSYLTITVSDDSKLDGLAVTRNGKPFDPMLWNRALPVDGGSYAIAARAPGHDDWQTTAAVAIAGARVTIEVPRLKLPARPVAAQPPPPPRTPQAPAPQVAATQVAAAQPAPAAPPAPDRAAEPSRFTPRRKIALGAAGVAVVSTAAALVLGASARSKQDDAFRLCPQPATPCDGADQSNALIQSSHHRALEANIAFGVAAAAAIGAGVLWFTGAPETETAARAGIAPSLAPGGGGVAVVGRF